MIDADSVFEHWQGVPNPALHPPCEFTDKSGMVCVLPLGHDGSHICLVGNELRSPEPRKYAAVLAEDLRHLSKVPLPRGAKDFDNPYFSVAPMLYHVELVCKAKYAWDECSGVPNFKWAKDASCFHDAIYQFAEALAALWGCTVREVLDWADNVFLERMLQDADSDKARCWACIYFVGVRIFGYRYHQIARFFRRVVGRPLGIIKP